MLWNKELDLMLIMNLEIWLWKSVEISGTNNCKYKHELDKHKQKFKVEGNKIVYTNWKDDKSWTEINLKRK